MGGIFDYLYGSTKGGMLKTPMMATNGDAMAESKCILFACAVLAPTAKAAPGP
jgi:hypothetical protein